MRSALILSDDANLSGALGAALGKVFSPERSPIPKDGSLPDLLERRNPDVLIYDFGEGSSQPPLPDEVGSYRCLVLGADETDSMIAAVEAGARGYISRDAPFTEIVGAAKSVDAGVAVIPPFMLGALLHHVVERRRIESASVERLDELTKREREVFELAAIGLNHDGVAERLFVSPATARTHLHRIFKKLDIHSKAELVALAAACGLATTEES